MPRPHPFQPVLGTFKAVTLVVAPIAADFDAQRWAEGEARVAGALAGKPTKVIRRLVLFLRLVNVLALIRFGRSFERLSAPRAGRLLESLEASPLLLLRRGTWGVRTFGFLAVYPEPDTATVLGYRAHATGWGADGVATGPWPDRGGAAPPEAEVAELLKLAAKE